MIDSVGPLPLSEHLLWFVLLSLVVFLVYNGLREESLGLAVRHGLRRWVAFVVGTVVLAVGFHLLSSTL